MRRDENIRLQKENEMRRDENEMRRDENKMIRDENEMRKNEISSLQNEVNELKRENQNHCRLETCQAHDSKLSKLEGMVPFFDLHELLMQHLISFRSSTLFDPL